jgi:hypothetical protein
MQFVVALDIPIYTFREENFKEKERKKKEKEK